MSHRLRRKYSNVRWLVQYINDNQGRRKGCSIPLSNYLNLSDEVTAEELNLIAKHFLYTSTDDEIIHKGLDIRFADEVTAKKMEEESVACTQNIVNRYKALIDTID